MSYFFNEIIGEEGPEYKMVFVALPGCKEPEHTGLFAYNVVSGQKMYEHLSG